MKGIISTIVLTTALVAAVTASAPGRSSLEDIGLRRGLFYSLAPKDDMNVAPGEDIDAPVHLTPLLDNPEDARAVAAVTNVGPYPSYAGFFTTNTTTDNNIFIWYFPALNKDPNAPLLIWFQGGPGGSSMFGLFSEVGPLKVRDASASAVIPNNWTWATNHSMLFIDNPVGAGFSYTGTGNGYAQDQSDVSRDLISTMVQFYKMFPSEAKNPLYLTGESFAGHYIPAFGTAIIDHNAANPQTPIPLAGVSIGDGWTDPINQLKGYADLMFNLGLADAQQRSVIEGYCVRARALIEVGRYADAFKGWDEMLNGDIFPYPNYFHNITGSNDYDNFMRTNAPESFGYYSRYLNLTVVRNAIHVGNATFNNGHLCEMNLVSDVMFSYKSNLARIASTPGMKVLLYNGQLDLIVGVPLTELYIPTMDWPGKKSWSDAPRTVWKVQPNDPEIAGFAKQVGDFTQIVVRGAGHIVPYDKPRESLDMITRFVAGTPFTN